MGSVYPERAAGGEPSCQPPRQPCSPSPYTPSGRRDSSMTTARPPPCGSTWCPVCTASLASCGCRTTCTSTTRCPRQAPSTPRSAPSRCGGTPTAASPARSGPRARLPRRSPVPSTPAATFATCTSTPVGRAWRPALSPGHGRPAGTAWASWTVPCARVSPTRCVSTPTPPPTRAAPSRAPPSPDTGTWTPGRPGSAGRGRLRVLAGARRGTRSSWAGARPVRWRRQDADRVATRRHRSPRRPAPQRGGSRPRSGAASGAAAGPDARR